jgi:hypothetical protein
VTLPSFFFSFTISFLNYLKTKLFFLSHFMTISPSIDPIISISIELLPEFGFTIQDEPVYGPGSVFQGTSKAA